VDFLDWLGMAFISYAIFYKLNLIAHAVGAY
jgi:hypothetical protein